jgi:hypothetical protein
VKTRQLHDDLSRLRGSAATLEQRTFRTPLDRLESFVSSLLQGDPPFISASLIVQQVVFTPTRLDQLLSRYDLPVDHSKSRAIVAETARETTALLNAALAEWVDFYFLPVPQRFILYADHDEYTTVYAGAEATLLQMAEALTGAGFSEVSGYLRK